MKKADGNIEKYNVYDISCLSSKPSKYKIVYSANFFYKYSASQIKWELPSKIYEYECYNLLVEKNYYSTMKQKIPM